MTNPLVAERKDSTQSFSGVPILESVDETKKAIESGDWASGVMGAVGTGLDALGMAMDPFGAILSAGVGWLIEHVGPLSEALDALTGDPDQIKAHSETWKNIATELGEVNTEMANLVKNDTAGWTGAAGDAYRARSADTGKLIEAAQKAADGASGGIGTAGEVVGAVRTLVRDIIAELVGHLVSWALQVLATLGIAMAWVLPQVVAAVAKTVAKIADLTMKLVKAIKALAPLVKKLGSSFGDAKKALDKIKADGGKGSGPKPEPKPGPKNGGPESTKSQGADGSSGTRGGPGGSGNPPPAQGNGPAYGPPHTGPSRPPKRPKPQSGHSGGPQSGQPGQGNAGPQNNQPQKPEVISWESFVDHNGNFDASAADNFIKTNYPGFQNINKPAWDAGTPGHNLNCGYSSVATGHYLNTGNAYPVGPGSLDRPFFESDVIQGAAQNGAPGGKFSNFPGGYNQLSHDMAQQPPGTSAVIKEDYPQSAHLFNVHHHPNGAVVYLDAQSGTLGKISNPITNLNAMPYPKQNP